MSEDPNNPLNPPKPQPNGVASTEKAPSVDPNAPAVAAPVVAKDTFVPHAGTVDTLEAWARGMNSVALLERIKADLDSIKPTLHIETAQRFAAKVDAALQRALA